MQAICAEAEVAGGEAVYDVLLLASNASSWMTAQQAIVDGGQVVWRE